MKIALMTASLFTHSFPEPSQKTAFSHNRLDRRSEDRPDGLLEQVLDQDSTLFLGFSGGNVLFHDGDIFHERAVIDGFEPDYKNASLLGWDRSNQAYIAIHLNKSDIQDPFEYVHPRTVYSDGLANDETLGILAQGASIYNFVRANLYCGATGQPTVPKSAGYHRYSPAADRTYFPRTDPVVIMLIVDKSGDRCLLGRSPHFASHMYSALAGFLEPGETIEDAVRRETLEEAGIKIGAVSYHASQPWPMPHTLMIGCFAQALTEHIDFDREELADCRWFTKDEVAERLKHTEGEERQAPPEGAIAHRLMRDWVDS